MTKHELESIIQNVLEEALTKETKEIKNLNIEVHDLVEKVNKVMQEIKSQNKELPSDVIAHMSIGKVLGTIGLSVLVPVAGVYMKLNNDMIEAKKDIQICQESKIEMHTHIDKIENRITANEKRIESLENITSTSLNSITNKVRNLEKEQK